MASDLNRSIKIYIDNSDALAKASQLESTIAGLRAELTRLSAEGKRDSVEYIKKESEVNKLEKSYGKYKNTVSETERVLRNLSGSTYKDLLATKRLIQRELQNETRGTEAYTAKLKVYQAVQKEINVAQKEMNSSFGANATIMTRAANGFNKYFGMATAAIASITGISYTFRKVSQDAAKMDDVYADVMKTTGLTRDEVVSLNEEFKKMDTRTAREQLNDLARDAGKLGITGKKDILDFVEAGNQINVALGEDLGEGAIREIGKITEVYKKSTKELDSLDLKGRMLSVGSAINEIGQSSTASEQYLVDFSQRLGGVAAQAGISIQNILGYASALDQSGLQVEMSATAFQQFVMKVFSDPAKYAKIAGLEVTKFTQLLKTDANEAIKTVLKSLSERGGFQQLIPIFDQMGLDGARAVGVLSSLATNIHLVDEAQKISNTSFAQATSLTNEYDKKNNNLMASLEKRRKEFQEASRELGQRLNPALLKSTNILTYIVRFLPSVLDFFAKYGPALLRVTALIVAYNLAVKAQSVWTKLALVDKTKMFIATQKEIAQQTALALKFVFTSGSTKQLSTSLKALWSVIKVNPWGLLLSAITAVTLAIIEWRKHNSKLISESDAIVEINKKVTDSVAREKSELDLLLATSRNEKISKDERLKAIKRLNEISPEYLGNLTLENINTDAARISVEKYTNALIINAKQKAIADATTELYSKKLKNEAQILENEAYLERLRAGGGNGSEMFRIMDERNEKLRKENSELDQQIGIYEKLNENILVNNDKTSNTQSSKFADLEREKQLLSDLESQYAKVYNKKNQPKSGVLKDDVPSFGTNNQQFTDEYQLRFLAQRVEKQRALVVAKEKELSTTKQIVSAETDGNSDSSISSGSGSKSIYDKKIQEIEKYIAREKALIQQKYIDGKINEAQYNKELEYLEQERLRKSLNASGISFEQQKEIELKIFEYKQAALKKIEDEEKQHAERLAKIQEDAAKARAEKNLNLLKQIAQQNTDNYKLEREKQLKQKAELLSLGFDFADEMGSMLGGAIAGNEDLVSSSLKNLINMALDFLKVQVEMAVAGATAQSLAQPDSIVTFGASGLARAAVIVGLIEAAFAAVKGVVSSAINNITGTKSSYISGNEITTGKRVVTQQAFGKYDVIGASDGRLYSGVPYVGAAATGIIPRPTLVGEYGPELVVSAPDLVRLQRHVNYPLVIKAIQESRVPQHASGNYSSVSSPVSSATAPIDLSVIDDLNKLLRSIKETGIRASVNYHEFERARNEIETIRSGSRRK